MKIPEILQEQQAKEKGYRSITKPYRLHDEQERKWFRNAIMDGQNSDMVIVDFAHGSELWRHKSELGIDPITGMRVKIDREK